MRWWVTATLIVFVATSCSKKDSSGVATAAPYHKIDMHTHFPPRAAARMVGLMDRYGVATVVNLSGGSPGRGLEEQLAAARTFPGRIKVFANLDWRLATTGDGYGQKMAANLARAAELGAVGLKIPKGLGIGFVDADRQLIAVDAPELDPVFEAAGRLGLPVSIHTGDPVAFWSPPTEDNERYAELSVHPGWSFYGQPVPSWQDLFDAFERRVARHPNTTFIGVHFGNAPEFPDRVRAMLDKYPNLYIDTAARVPEIGRRPAKQIKSLFADHADRILFGTDLGVGTHPLDLMLGSTGATPPTKDDVDHFFASTWRYFETSDRDFAHPTPVQGEWTISGIELAPELLKKLYGANAARLLGLEPPKASP